MFLLNVYPHHAIVLIMQQLWTSSKETLYLKNEDGVHFFQMLNRYTLAADSQKLFENGGMLLMKAMNRSIVISHRAPVGSTVPSPEYSSSATSSRSKAVGGGRVAESRVDYADYWRGGSLPFEMVRALSRNSDGCIVIYHAFILFFKAGFFFPGTVFRFPVFLAVTSEKDVALGFAAQVRQYDINTFWYIFLTLLPGQS
jgi:hypothetical protein